MAEAGFQVDSQGVASPVVTEVRKGPETRSLFVSRETQTLASNLLTGKVREVGAEAREKVGKATQDWKEANGGQEPSPQQRKELQDTTLSAADRLFLSLETINAVGREADGKPKEQSLIVQDEKPQGEPLRDESKGENAILIQKADGTVVELTHLQKTNADGTLTCLSKKELASGSVSYEEVVLSRKDLGQAVIAAEKDLAREAFAGDPAAQVIIEQYAAALDPQNPKDIEPSAELDAALESVAKAKGVLTADDVRSFVDHLPKEDRESAQAKQLLGRLEGKVLLSPDDMGGILTASGFTPERLGDKIIDIGTEISKLQKELDNASDDASKGILQESIDAKLAEQKLYGQTREMLKRQGDQNPLEQYNEAVLIGKIPPEAAKVAIEAFRNGDIQGMVEGMMDGIPELQIPEGATTEEIAAIKKKREVVWKATKGTFKWAGIVALILAALPAVAAVAVHETAGKMGR